MATGYSPTLAPTQADAGNPHAVPESLPRSGGMTVNLPLSGVNPYIADVTRTDQAKIGLIDRWADQRAALAARGTGEIFGPMARSGKTDYRSGTNAETMAGFNFAMWDTLQTIDPMIEKKVLTNPRFWHDRIPRGQFMLHDGAVHQSRIFRAGLEKYAGLDEWEAIDPVPSINNDPCHFPKHGMYNYGWDQLAWSGMSAAWGSQPICRNAFRYVKDAAQQLALILDVGMERGIQMQEVFNRDTYLSKSTDFGRSYIMTSDFRGTAKGQSPRYFYDPFVKFGDTGSSSTKTANKSLVSKAFIVIDASCEIEPINWLVLDRVHELLKLRCPDAALGQDAGEPLFGLMVNSEDVDKSVVSDDKVYREWREAKPLALIQKYNLSPKVYNRWAIVSDSNQLRFKIKRYIATWNSTECEKYGGVGAELAAVSNSGVYIAEAVDPFIPDPDRVGINGGPLPIENADYIDAELAIAPVFMNDVMTNLFEAGEDNLGSGTHFGPYPALNGQWSWVLSPQTDDDPFQQTGKFYGLFRIHQKPEPRVRDVMSFLYRRCKETIRAKCPIESKYANPDGYQWDTNKTGALKATTDVTTTVGTQVTAASGDDDAYCTVTLKAGSTFEVIYDKAKYGPLAVGQACKLAYGTGSSDYVEVLAVDSTMLPYVTVATKADVTGAYQVTATTAEGVTTYVTKADAVSGTSTVLPKLLNAGAGVTVTTTATDRNMTLGGKTLSGCTLVKA